MYWTFYLQNFSTEKKKGQDSLTYYLNRGKKQEGKSEEIKQSPNQHNNKSYSTIVVEF